MMDTATAARAVDGSVVGATVAFARVTTDTRGLIRGDLFVALKGERFDGHDFVADALGAGAVAALVERSRAPSLSGNLIAVDAGGAAILDERGGCTISQRLRDKVVAVEALTFQRDEQIAGGEGARIGRDAGEVNCRADDGSTDRACGHRRIHHAPLLRASASATWRASEKGIRLPFAS